MIPRGSLQPKRIIVNKDVDRENIFKSPTEMQRLPCQTLKLGEALHEKAVLLLRQRRNIVKLRQVPVLDANTEDGHVILLHLQGEGNGIRSVAESIRDQEDHFLAVLA